MALMTWPGEYLPHCLAKLGRDLAWLANWGPLGLPWLEDKEAEVPFTTRLDATTNLLLTFLVGHEALEA